MSSDNSNNSNNNNGNKPPSPPPNDMMQRQRRGSITTNAFALFQRSNSTAGTAVMPSAITAAAISEQRRRLSLSTTTLGMTGTSPTSASLGRRASMSTNSDSLDENAIEEEDSPTSSRNIPANPFNRRVSFGTSAGMRRPGVPSPASGNGMPNFQSSADAVPPSVLQQLSCSGGAMPPTPPDSATSMSTTIGKPQSFKTTQTVSNKTTSSTRPRATSDLFSSNRSDQGFNWSEQLRSRAESTVASGSRPSFSFASGMTGSPPRSGAFGNHDRAKSVSEMPAPPAQTPKPRSPPRDTRPKPDAFQERILKGDFYMD